MPRRPVPRLGLAVSTVSASAVMVSAVMVFAFGRQVQRLDAIVADQAHHDISRALQNLTLGQVDAVAALQHPNPGADVAQETSDGGIDGDSHGVTILGSSGGNPKKCIIWWDIVRHGPSETEL